jgi:hypothetical protein
MSFLALEAGKALGHEGRKLGEAVETMSRAFGEALTVLGYGLDYESYCLFRTFSPIVHEFYGGRMEFEWMQRAPPSDARLVERCLAFTLEAALKLGRNLPPEMLGPMNEAAQI